MADKDSVTVCRGCNAPAERWYVWVNGSDYVVAHCLRHWQIRADDQRMSLEEWEEDVNTGSTRIVPTLAEAQEWEDKFALKRVKEAL